MSHLEEYRKQTVDSLIHDKQALETILKQYAYLHDKLALYDFDNTYLHSISKKLGEIKTVDNKQNMISVTTLILTQDNSKLIEKEFKAIVSGKLKKDYEEGDLKESLSRYRLVKEKNSHLNSFLSY